MEENQVKFRMKLVSKFSVLGTVYIVSIMGRYKINVVNKLP